MTVLFSDLSGFTAMSEQCDPEELRALLGRLFGEAAQAVAQFGGHIDHFVGDAVMALFGSPLMHEDDAVRAVRAAREIHRRAAGIKMLDGSGHQMALHMHTGIATGLVVVSHTGADGIGDLVLGDTVNVASRLTDLAKPGEVVVGESTHALACGQFDFDPLGPIRVRGRAGSVRAFRLRRPKRDPETLHRLTGLRAEFVGRQDELARMDSAAKALLRGSSTFVGVVGAAGTGKSRLVAEFRAGDISRGFIWREAHCFEYAGSVPYSAVLDLLGRAWDIDPADDLAHVHAKIHAGLQRALGEDGLVTARVERLWSIDSPLLTGVDPESWRTQVFDDLSRVLDAITLRGPTVLLIEDLQWADDASLELLAYALARISAPIVVLGTYRPSFDASRVGGGGWRREEIVLDDLSPDDAVALACSLLRADELPAELERFVRLELGGNPFHVEESMNALVETGVLVLDADEWRLTKQLHGAEAPLTVAASVAARVDLLGEDLKRTVQAAAVMGRVFSADMLDQVAPSGRDVIDALAEIVRFGLVVPIGDPADRMFAFKHVLTQNAIEQELLHDERRALHDRTARAYEVLYADRLPEFYEAIAFHFERGHAAREAVRYLVRAGEKSLSRYAVNQASRYFRRAYEIALETPTLAADSVLLVDLLVRWARVDYYLGSFRELESLMLRHYASLEYVAPELQARYEVWLGTVFWHRQSLSRAYEHLTRGRALAEQADEPPWVALADAELAYVHADLGRLPEAVECSERACAAARLLDSDAFVWEEAFSSAGYTHWCTGNVAEAHRLGAELLAYGTAHTNIRCLAFGHWMVSLAYLNDGDFKSATEETDKALRVSADPWLLQFPKFFSAICRVFNGEFDRALPLLEEVVEYSTERGAETLSIPATGLLGAARAGTGSLDGGIAMLERCERRLRDDERLWAHINAIYILGELHAIIARGEAEMGLREALRNPRFLVGHAPFAERRAYRYLEQAASGCDSVGAVGLAGQCWLSIAELQHAKGHDARSADSFERARSRFVACGAQTFAKRAASELAELSS